MAVGYEVVSDSVVVVGRLARLVGPDNRIVEDTYPSDLGREFERLSRPLLDTSVVLLAAEEAFAGQRRSERGG